MTPKPERPAFLRAEERPRSQARPFNASSRRPIGGFRPATTRATSIWRPTVSSTASATSRRSSALLDLLERHRRQCPGERRIRLESRHHMDLARQMNATAAHVAHDVSEFKVAGLTAVPGKLVNVPRVADKPVAFECKLTQIHPVAGRQWREGAGLADARRGWSPSISTGP